MILAEYPGAMGIFTATAVAWTLTASAAFLVGYSVVVTLRYLQRWRRMRDQGLQVSLLPLHVWMVAFSYDLLLVGVSVQAVVRLRWWHPLIYFPAIAIGIVAMAVLNKRRGDVAEGRRASDLV